MKHKKILVAGFERFGRTQAPNVSSEVALPLIQERYGDTVDTLVLPVARDVAAEVLSERIQELSPSTVAIFGMSAGRKVRLEKRAKNWRYNLLIPDNEGRRTMGRIIPGGPLSLESTLSLRDIGSALEVKGVPTTMSADAGSFLCNEVMYRALHDPATSAIPTGFIHLGRGMEESLIETAALTVYETLLDNLPEQ